MSVQTFYIHSNTESVPDSEVLHHHPNSAAVVDALQSSAIYGELTRHYAGQHNNEQSPVKNTLCDNQKGAKSSTRTGCLAYNRDAREMKKMIMSSTATMLSKACIAGCHSPPIPGITAIPVLVLSL